MITSVAPRAWDRRIKWHRQCDQGIAYDSQAARMSWASRTLPISGTKPVSERTCKSSNASGAPSAVITKFSPDGSSLVYSTYLGGSNYDYGEAIAVDSTARLLSSGNPILPIFHYIRRVPDCLRAWHQRSMDWIYPCVYGAKHCGAQVTATAAPL